MSTTLYIIDKNLLELFGIQSPNPFYTFDELTSLFEKTKAKIRRVNATHLMLWATLVIRNGLVVKSRQREGSRFEIGARFTTVLHARSEPAFKRIKNPSKTK